MGVTIEGLADAASVLGQAVLGPAELEKALGYDPLSVLTPDERRAVSRVPFARADLERAKTDGEFLVLRVPRDPDGPLTMLALSKRLSGGLDPKVHTGVGYMLRTSGRSTRSRSRPGTRAPPAGGSCGGRRSRRR